MTSLSLALSLLLAPQATDDRVVSWLKTGAIPIKAVQAGKGFGDLAPLQKVFAGVDIVGMGEATHGSREIFQMKHRMFEFLVEKMGFEVFALEASLPEVVVMDRFVTKGERDVDYAVMSSGFWTWSTEEVRDLLLWMRKYNLDPKHKRKLRIVGVDMQSQAGATLYFQRILARLGLDDEAVFWEEVSWEPPSAADMKRVNELLDRTYPQVQAKFGAEEATLFRQVRVVFHQAIKNSGSARFHAARAQAMPFLGEALQGAEALLKDSQSLDADSRSGLEVLVQLAKKQELKPEDAPKLRKYAGALRANGTRYEPSAKVLELFAIFAEEFDVLSGAHRDRSMAENLEWVYKTYLPKKKIMLWAHNSHVANASMPDEPVMLGSHLTKRFGNRYYPVGFVFNQGAFRAIGVGQSAVKVWEVGPARQDSMDALLARTGNQNFFVDFGRANAEAKKWFGEPRLTRNFGSLFSPEAPHYRAIIPSKAFRGVIFLNKIAAAKPVG